ncbi:GSCOCG00011784001-RA-CDS, partial [Cotesia congregata]
PKPDGSSRFILNLKKLNEFIKTNHFKLEYVRTARDLLRHPYCFMTTLDLKDAYYLVSIKNSSKKYLRFIFSGVLYEFTCLPFGLCTAPYVFTKLMNPVISLLREKGYLSVVYIDDFLLIGYNKQECLSNIQKTILLLESLGFIINKQKSNFEPSHKQKFLGFILNSANMRIELPKAKKTNFASFIGILGSLCPAARYGWVYMKNLEREKFLALEKNLNWWKQNMNKIFMPIKNHKFTLEIFSDASLTGWGASCGNNKANGFWNIQERNNPINFLELKAAFFGLKCFACKLNNCDILLRIDNTTAIAYINRMGGIQFENLSYISKCIWKWCEQRNIFIYASYISSKDNTIADYESRRLEPETEYCLSPFAFNRLCTKFGYPEVDLFASRTNTKCNKYVSWKKDPGSFAVDAFTLDWEKFF